MEWYELGTRALGAFGISYGVSRFLIPLMIAIAQRMSVVDAPDGKLKTHKAATPYLGGIAVYVGFITALALFFPIHNDWWFMIVGTTLLLFVGLIDDLIVLTPLQKWWGQIVAAICFVRGGFYLKEAFLLAYSPTYAPIILLIVSCIWMLLIINAFNLIDVMDGLATTVALSMGCMLIIHAVLLHHPMAVLLLVSLIGSLLAFFECNKPIALIYLGDSGSLFLGGLFAIVPFMISWGTHQVYGFLTPLMLFFIPLMEVSMLILIRTLRGIPFYQGSPDHFCLYLKRKGWSIKEILLFVVLFSIPLLLFSVLFVLGVIPVWLFLCLGILLATLWSASIFVDFSALKTLLRGEKRVG